VTNEEHSEKEYVTKEKFQELKKELDFLKTIRRKEVAESLEYAKSLGDLSENAEYQEARENQAKVEDRIARLEMIMKTAEIVTPRTDNVVGIGSTVVVRKGKNKETRTLHIVGSEESNMAEGKISDQSPLGAAMVGKKKGDIFTITTPGGKVEYTIVEVK
jgi:transcription elongation factor GreA